MFNAVLDSTEVTNGSPTLVRAISLCTPEPLTESSPVRWAGVVWFSNATVHGRVITQHGRQSSAVLLNDHNRVIGDSGYPCGP